MKKYLFILGVLIFSLCLNVKAATPSLTDLQVDGKTIAGFKSDKYDYTLEVEANKDKITFGFVFDTNAFSGKGSTGERDLNPGKNTFTFTLTDKQNKDVSKTYTIVVNRKDNRSSDNSLSSLTIGGVKVTLDSKKNDYEISVPSDTEEVSIKATISNLKAKFVQGYGERTVKLIGEKTPVEVRVEAENGSVRKYNVVVIKSDYKSNDASLKSLKIKEINFKFDKNTTEYNLEVEHDIEKINVEAVVNDNKASVTYNKEYTLKEGKNNISITVVAEDEKTKREYKLVITRKEEEPLVKDIKITDVEFEFKNDVYEYEIETELTKLNFEVTLNSKTATSEIINNQELINGSKVLVEVVDRDKKVTYTFTIKNDKEEEITPIIEDTNSDNLNNSTPTKSSFLKKYEMYIGLGTFGVGLLSLLIAILTKPKGSQIM